MLAAGVLGCWAQVACAKDEPLPKYHHIGSFRLKNQEGKPFGSEDLRAQVWVAAFMFTRCPTVCPRMMRHMRQVQLAAKDASLPLRLVSFSVDPDHDTPSVLQAYAKEHGADTNSWTFVTGDFETLKQTSVEGFKVALEGEHDPKADHFGIIHGSYLILVDQRGIIRGYYSTEDPDTVSRLLLDARTLLD